MTIKAIKYQKYQKKAKLQYLERQVDKILRKYPQGLADPDVTAEDAKFLKDYNKKRMDFCVKYNEDYGLHRLSEDTVDKFVREYGLGK